VSLTTSQKIHRRGAENAEKTHRSNRELLCSYVTLRLLCVLCASAVNLQFLASSRTISTKSEINAVNGFAVVRGTLVFT